MERKCSKTVCILLILTLRIPSNIVRIAESQGKKGWRINDLDRLCVFLGIDGYFLRRHSAYSYTVDKGVKRMNVVDIICAIVFIVVFILLMRKEFK